MKRTWFCRFNPAAYHWTLEAKRNEPRIWKTEKENIRKDSGNRLH
ncbi:MAG TPA: hypothetical protein PL048_12680 [Leptospiraceae bacterium]|nr:hypothetical protein [Leptospiraceae bacterium]HNN02067.1 hypothetical protein [Leptospiraceae bacterium]